MEDEKSHSGDFFSFRQRWGLWRVPLFSQLRKREILEPVLLRTSEFCLLLSDV